MEFRIEATIPTAPADLGNVLAKARTAWLESTPQNHPPASPEGTALAAAEEHINGCRLAVDDRHPATAVSLQRAVQAHKDLIKTQSSSPNAETKGACELIDAGIAMAVAGAARSKAPVRCSVVGHFEVPTGGTIPRPVERLSVHLDHAG